ncbi:hypothetical protein scyTo_0016594 [Scyliorhinus torazame]|uniref:G-protein coupled receptors family 1 profile domain-containing protein n=1 Tax=Scyliorhinus torazame TaxID=75743 RepID=A0A401PU46_SCYTO|nr:hypothetical protein [Scyliorhinus torazame]
MTTDRVSVATHTFTIVVSLVTFFLGVPGNGLVIWVTAFKMKRTVNTVWFQGLALADFVFSLLLPFTVALTILDFHWPFGTAFCKINSGVAVLTMFSSVLTLTAISLDRCISVVLPVWSQNHRRPRLAALISLALWGAAFLLSIPTFFYRDTMKYRDITRCYTNFLTSAEGDALNSITGEDYKAMLKKLISIKDSRFKSLAIVRFVFGFLLPFLIIGASYTIIGLRLWRDRLAPSWKPFKVMIAIILAFLLCWAPHHTFIFLRLWHPPSPHLVLALRVGNPLSSSLASFNSCLNPILYICMGHNFREKVKRSCGAFLRKVLENAFVEDSMHFSATSRAKTKSMTLGDDNSTLV